MQILIVDDDVAIVDAIEASVNWEHFQITDIYKAYSVQSAKQQLLSERIDIVISDIEMPGGNGLELLKWFREQEQEGEFLLLTCHEKFDYAVNAVKMQAVEYLLKPFDKETLEGALQKCILNIQMKKQQKENRKWLYRNLADIRQNVFQKLLKEEFSESLWSKAVKSTNNRIGLKKEQNYVLLVSRVTEIRQIIENYGESVARFMLMNIQTESLYGRPEIERAICFGEQGELIVVIFAEQEDLELLFEKCRKIQENCSKYMGVSVTLCISRPCRAEAFHSSYAKIHEKLFSDVSAYGKISYETEVEKQEKTVISLQSAENLTELLVERKKSAFLNQLKQELSGVNLGRNLNRQDLEKFKQEILQIIYSYLTEKGISAAHLFGDAVFSEMERKSLRSVLDMIRWVNHMLDRIFSYEAELKNSNNIINKIDEYIRGHYQEHIGRNEIAEAFYLTPEYLAKMYKRKTGINLKDAVNECRIQKAKKLLGEGRAVSDVAVDVGFDNFSYFSTVFRKYTGVSPSEYKKAQETSF